MKNKKTFIPSLFTAFNIFCGYLAILKIIEGNYITACWLVFLAAIFDSLDGRLARMMNTASNFGVEFDSIADVISFGVAPSILLYNIYFNKMGILGVIISFSPLIFGGIRLARFNIQLVGFEKSNFSGLPIPVAAISFISFAIFNNYFWDEIHLTRFIIPQLTVVCILMVSTIEYPTFPKMTFKAGRKHSSLILFVILCFILLMLFPHQTMYPMTIGYTLYGILMFLYKLFKSNGETDDDNQNNKKSSRQRRRPKKEE